jgi:hypothetical protein
MGSGGDGVLERDQGGAREPERDGASEPADLGTDLAPPAAN